MRTILSIFLMTLLSFGFFCNDAAAKRFGGGRSFGVQRPMGSYSTPGSSNSFFNKGAASKTNPNRGGMLGGLFGGLLLGGLLTSLFMGNGFMSGLLTWLALGAIVLLLINLFRRRMPNPQSGNTNQFSSSNPFETFKNTLAERSQQFNEHSNSGQQQSSFQNQARGGVFGSSVDEDFLREAKVKFIRLQTAYDQQNLEDIREFTTPEVVGEIQMQFQEQEGAINQTEVVSLEAELLGTEQEGNTEIASVRFTGSIKENSEQAEPLNEIWHFQKTGVSGQWVVSGVQQVKPL